MIVALIIAGGKGERFWPKSRSKIPKQLLPIAGKKSMIQETVERLDGLIPPTQIFVVTEQSLVAKIGEQLPQIPRKNIIGEPFGRNTAAAIGLAAVKVEKEIPGATMVILPADHLIRQKEKFHRAVQIAVKAAEAEACPVTFGIKPTYPATGYGYIEISGEHRGEEGEVQVYQSKCFCEKPDVERAREFIATGRFFWNSGIFVWTIPAFKAALQQHMPSLHQKLVEITPYLNTTEEEVRTREAYEKLENISIDYGVMEKVESAFVVKADFFWDDVGSWLALERISEADNANNVIKGDFACIDTSDCIIISERGLVGTVGVSGLVIVATDDAVLVCAKERAEEVKKLVQEIAKNKEWKQYL